MVSLTGKASSRCGKDASGALGGGVHTGPVGGYSSEALPNVHGRSPAEILKQASGNMFLQYPLIRLSASFTSLPLSSATHCPPPPLPHHRSLLSSSGSYKEMDPFICDPNTLGNRVVTCHFSFPSLL